MSKLNMFDKLSEEENWQYIRKIINGNCYLVSMQINEYYVIQYNVPTNRKEEVKIVTKGSKKQHIIFLADKSGKIKTLKASAFENDYVEFIHLKSI